ncbi:LuxR C-terminal-related transcriptional regulator [Thalassotalea fonticola]|uniref:LuxR C-terminal-related transcriptional regulator n=1 Tax=Thalassotalea fonticola TaxID=3065649 RepID=A0ABZ0GLD9_9GAMM|nr:LuxR C-terminal-related transcriptional regulator [Colwelliaceae bacterium S1-1]
MATIKDLTYWHQVLATVISKDFNSESISDLLRGLEHLLNASSAMLTIFPEGKQPQTTHYRLLANENPQHQIDPYDSGAYLLDPFYRMAIDEKIEGPYAMSDVAPQGFEQSEYFDLFYKKQGYLDEICIIFQLNEHDIASISLVRHTNEEPFKAQHIKQLNIVFPLLKSIIVKCQQNIAQPEQLNLERHLDNALVKFGSSILTPRECKILHYILHGYAIKFIAEKLENSLETIKHHRKSIYMKLDVSSQSELFYLFIASLKAMPADAALDPLTYLT